jgi:quercetin dioxygenase-like cupin family protein
VISGRGKASLRDSEIDLVPGVMFALEEKELHRFRTSDSEEVMKIIAFHPDGDWGPTDENHTMINRTYIAE